MKSLLLISCSNRKLKLPGNVPAVQRYDGGNYRVIRRMQREGKFPVDVDVKIVSAKFGLIGPTKLIPLYDLRMNRQRADRLRANIQMNLSALFAKRHYSEIYIDLGSDYLPVLDGLVAEPGARILIASGRIGERLHKLKVWLSSHS